MEDVHFLVESSPAITRPTKSHITPHYTTLPSTTLHRIHELPATALYRGKIGCWQDEAAAV